MELQLFESASLKIAELSADTVVINSAQDALDIMCRASEMGAQSIILQQHQQRAQSFHH